jgi:hypothetical protein
MARRVDIICKKCGELWYKGYYWGLSGTMEGECLECGNMVKAEWGSRKLKLTGGIAKCRKP